MKLFGTTTLLLITLSLNAGAVSAPPRCASLFQSDTGHSGKKNRLVNWQHDVVDLGHPEVILDLINSIKDPGAIESVLIENGVQLPELFISGEKNDQLSEVFNHNNYSKNQIAGPFHGTSLKNALNIQKNGISFSGGEGEIVSGFYTTHIKSNAQGWAQNVVHRNDSLNYDMNDNLVEAVTSPEAKLKRFLEDPNAEIKAIIEIKLNPNARLINLAKPGKGNRIFGPSEPPSYSWFINELKEKRGPLILRQVVSEEFIAKYFNAQGAVKPEGHALFSKQAFAHLFGVDGLITDALYGQRREPEIVLVSPHAIKSTKIHYNKQDILAKKQKLQDIVRRENEVMKYNLQEGRIFTIPGDRDFVVKRVDIEDNLIYLESKDMGSRRTITIDDAVNVLRK